MVGQYEAGYRPPGYRAANGSSSGGDRTDERTETGQESRESELSGLRDRAAADRAELNNPRGDGEPDAGPAQDGPAGSDDPERESDRDRTDRDAGPDDRPGNDDPEAPADATGGGDGRGDGPDKPPPPDDPDDGRDSPDEVARLRKELADAEARLDAANAHINEQDSTIDRLQNTCGYLDKQRRDADARADAAEARTDALAGEVTELRGTVTEQSAQIQTMSGKLDELGTMFTEVVKRMPSPDQVRPDMSDQLDQSVDRSDDGDGQQLGRIDARQHQSDAQDADAQVVKKSRGFVSDTTIGTAWTIANAGLADLAHTVPSTSGAITFGGGAIASVIASVAWVRSRRKAKDADRPES